MGGVVQGSNPGRGKIFQTHPEWPQGQPGLLYNGYQLSFSEVKQPEHGIEHLTPCSTNVEYGYSYTSISPQ